MRCCDNSSQQAIEADLPQPPELRDGGPWNEEALYVGYGEAVRLEVPSGRRPF